MQCINEKKEALGEREIHYSVHVDLANGIVSFDSYEAPLTSLACIVEVPEEEAPAPRYTTYIACGLSKYAKRASACPRRSRVGAFLRSSQDIEYTVCVVFPTGRLLCASDQQAGVGTLYVNKVTTSNVGRHKVIWYLPGARIVRYFWRL